MKLTLASVLIAAALLSGCNTAGGDISGPGLAPIPGSITYNGQPRTKLTKSPIGSAVYNDFYDQQGQRVYETYILQPDRSLKLVRRQIVPDFPQ
jgi:predicted small secreted protein